MRGTTKKEKENKKKKEKILKCATKSILHKPLRKGLKKINRTI